MFQRFGIVQAYIFQGFEVQEGSRKMHRRAADSPSCSDPCSKIDMGQKIIVPKRPSQVPLTRVEETHAFCPYTPELLSSGSF